MRVFGRIRREQHGQVLPLVALMALLLVGFVGFAVDMGRVFVAKQELQRAVDASALAAGQYLPDTASGYSAAVTYAGTGSQNAVGGWGVTAAPPNVTFECAPNAPGYTSGASPSCLTDSSGKSCHPTGSQTPNAATCNAVKVTETATVKTSFFNFFLPKFTLTASSTAAARGNGVPNPLNLFVILDTTGSMTQNCGATVPQVSNPDKLDCAKAGVRAMLQALGPCPTNQSSCGNPVSGTTNVANPVDEVGMVVFPAISETLNEATDALSAPSSTTLAEETDCKSNDSFDVTYPPYIKWTNGAGSSDGIPITEPFSFSPNAPTGDSYIGYEAVPLSSDYRASDSSTTLNTSSSLVESVDWGQCSGSNYPGGDYYGLKDIGGQGSYLAGAITEAQYLLSQAPARTGPNGQPAVNAIVILSDGEMTQLPSGNAVDGIDPKATGSGPYKNATWSAKTPCADALNAATQAKAANTLIYSIAYDSSGNCTDSGSGGDTMAAATLMQDLATNSQDYFSETDADSLATVFGEIGTQLSGDSRLIPDCAQAPPAC